MTVWEARQSQSSRTTDDARTPYDIDYGRIIHSASFRRLQGKTQILNLGDGDFYRTRLTHSMEVAQIAGGLVMQMIKSFAGHPAIAHLPPLCLIQTLGFAHDLGHPPFGHGGEVALNYCMRDHGGFEGNGQTLRVLTKLENFSRDNGANLTRRALLGVLKYPVPFSTAADPALPPRLKDGPTAIRIIDREASKPPKAYFDSEGDAVAWMLEPLSPADRESFQSFDKAPGKHAKTRHKSLDCSIMDVADDIAYGVHDLEDALSLGLIREADFREAVTEAASACFLDFRLKHYGEKVGNDPYGDMVGNLFAGGQKRKMIVNIIVSHLIGAIQIDEDAAFAEPLLRYRAALPKAQATFLSALKDLVWHKVIRSPQVQHMEFKGQAMVVSVFEAYQSEPKAYLPHDAYARFDAAHGDLRVICDHIAGMTDDHLMKTYDRFFSPRMGSIFDKL